LEQVLLRLPVKPLMRFKSVCKSWHDTISGERFKVLVVLPAGSPDYYCGSQKIGFGVDPSTGKYKVVRYSQRYCNEDMADYSIGCEVFTRGWWAWEPVADPPYLVKSMTPVCLPNAIYWSAGVTLSTQAMLRFDMHNEEFTTFPTPPCMELTDPCSSLTDLAGNLCYALTCGHTVQLWMTKDDGVQLPKWSLNYTNLLPWLRWSMIPFSPTKMVYISVWI
ncbi:hypothetical protein BAE44_0019816, partial [Dichanthelium oligosanthes]